MERKLVSWQEQVEYEIIPWRKHRPQGPLRNESKVISFVWGALGAVMSCTKLSPKRASTRNCLCLHPPSKIQQSSLVNGPMWSYHQRDGNPCPIPGFPGILGLLEILNSNSALNSRHKALWQLDLSFFCLFVFCLSREGAAQGFLWADGASQERPPDHVAADQEPSVVNTIRTALEEKHSQDDLGTRF